MVLHCTASHCLPQRAAHSASCGHTYRARFRHALAGVPRSTTRDADSRECAWLRAVGAAQPGAGKTKLCTLATVCRVLQKLGVASNSVQALASIRMDGGCNYELSASVAAASLHSVLPTLTQPATLPAMEFSQADLSEEYGLAVIRPGLLSRGTLSIQLDQLEAFSKMDVNTRRHGSRQATATYDGTVKKVDPLPCSPQSQPATCRHLSSETLSSETVAGVANVGAPILGILHQVSGHTAA